MKETVIDPRELRIGNFLLYKGEVVHVTTLSLDVDDECEETIGFCKLGNAHNEHADWNRALYPDLKGIPISTEWLERCGFTWDEENQIYSIQVGNAIYLEYDKDFDCSITPEDRPGKGAYVWGENKTVHRLQNLFCDLTGKQLEIKPL